MRKHCCIVLLLPWLSGALLAASITPRNFEFAARYSRAHGGVGLRVEQNGEVYQDYVPGFSASSVHRIFSGTKNFVAVAAIIAQQEGLLDLDEPASDTLPEWRNDRRRAITLDELLSQTSGLAPGADIIDSARDQFAAALRVRLIASPGTQFHYGPAGYQAFGEILKRKLRSRGRSVEGYIREKVLDPLDIDVPYWKHDDAGNPLLHAGMGMSARDWAKFGEFINHETEREKLMSTHQRFMRLFTGHDANPSYGLAFWLNRPLSPDHAQSIRDLEPAIDGDQLYPDGPRDLVAAEGTSQQRLYIIPSLDLVIVRFGDGAPYSDGDFLSRLLTGRPHPDAHSH